MKSARSLESGSSTIRIYACTYVSSCDIYGSIDSIDTFWECTYTDGSDLMHACTLV